MLLLSRDPFSDFAAASLHLDVLAQPPDGLTVALPHHNRAHEDLHRSDALQWDLALAGRLVHAELVSELVLGDGVGVVDLVAQDHEGDLGQLLHLEQRVQLGLRLGESLVVLGVDEEDDPVDLGEVVPPETAGCCQCKERYAVSSRVRDAS